MKLSQLIGLAIAAGLGLTAFAAEPQKAEVQNSKEQPQMVVVMSGKEVVTELKLIKPGTLKLEAGDIASRARPGGRGTVHNCSGGSKLELLSGGISVLTISADSMIIQNLKVSGLK